jgi:hypothetical protein
MKKAISLTALTFIGLAIVCSAQRFGHYFGQIWPEPIWTTNSVSAQSARVEGRYLTATKTTNLLIHVSFKLVDVGTGNATLMLYRAPENGIVCSNSPIPIVIAATGTSPVLWVTNLPMAGLPYLYWAYSSNANTAVLTNLTVWTGYKN